MEIIKERVVTKRAGHVGGNKINIMWYYVASSQLEKRWSRCQYRINRSKKKDLDESDILFYHWFHKTPGTIMAAIKQIRIQGGIWAEERILSQDVAKREGIGCWWEADSVWLL